MGLQLANLMGGSILVETVFAWPGTGLMLNNAIFQRDIPVLQGTILVLALFFVILNLLVDLIQTALDPRISRCMSTASRPPAESPPSSTQAADASPGYWRGVGAPPAARQDHPRLRLILIVMFMLLIVFAPLIAPYGPTRAASAGA